MSSGDGGVGGKSREFPIRKVHCIASWQITVTLKMEWDVSELGKPIPASYVTEVLNGTVLVNILNKAAGEEKKGPFNKYESVYYSGKGYYITAMNGTKQNATGQGKSWFIIDEQTGGYAPCGVSRYVPGDGSTTIFNFTTYSSHLNEAHSGYCKAAPSHGQVNQALKIKVNIKSTLFDEVDT